MGRAGGYLGSVGVQGTREVSSLTCLMTKSMSSGIRSQHPGTGVVAGGGAVGADDAGTPTRRDY